MPWGRWHTRSGRNAQVDAVVEATPEHDGVMIATHGHTGLERTFLVRWPSG